MLSQEKILSTLNKALKQSARVRKGTDAVYFCPSCNHKKRKLEINLITGKYHCWVCNLSGNSLWSLFKKLNLPREYLSELGHIKTKTTDDFDNLFKEDAHVSTDLVNLPVDFHPMSVPIKSIEYKNAMRYLRSRNISDVDILRYNIGYCESGEFKNRVILPSYSCNGTVNFYSGRLYYDIEGLKYKLCTSSKNIIGNEFHISPIYQITLVEGSFDAIAVRINAIPLFGKTMSQKLKLFLISNDIPHVNVVLDNDALSSAIDICEWLISHNVSVKLVKLDGKDPSILGFHKTWDLINKTDMLTFEELFKLKMNL